MSQLPPITPKEAQDKTINLNYPKLLILATDK